MDNHRFKNQATPQSTWTRYFGEAFKKDKVEELKLKQITKSKLVSLYGFPRTSFYK